MKSLYLHDVCKKYPKFQLDNVSFSIEEGSICGFIGRNGAGKTTTLKGIVKLLKFDSGSVDVFGHPFEENELENRQYISFSLSEINFFPDQTVKNLTKVTKRFYKEWDDDIYHKLISKFEIDETKKIKQLSSGMKVKYNLVIALSHNAKLLIFDEPTSGLDPVSRDEILDMFKSIVKSGKRSILFSTHITSDLDKCADHIVYIKKGKIIAKDSINSFKDSFRYVSGSLKNADKIKSLLISYKTDNDLLTGLIYAKDADKFADFKLSIPDLETVMIYQERAGEKDEEFII